MSKSLLVDGSSTIRNRICRKTASLRCVASVCVISANMRWGPNDLCVTNND